MEPEGNDLDSPLATALGQVGDRWTLLLVDGLLLGSARFGELQERVPGISTNVLTNRLRALERDGLLIAEAYSQRPLRYEYSLTATGKELAGALRMLAAWAATPGDHSPITHQVCGTPLEVRWFCPTCNMTTDGDEEPWRA